MTRVPITEPVLDQLETVLASDEIDDSNNRFAVRGVALAQGHEALATFIAEADAVRYTRALELLEHRKQ